MKKLLSLLVIFILVVSLVLILIGVKYSVSNVNIYETTQNDNITTVTVEYKDNLYNCTYSKNADYLFNENKKAIAIFYASDKADLTTYQIIALLPY